MDALDGLFAKLAEIPREPLADVPTAVERLADLSRHVTTELWVKRDDRSSATYGGNKVRKLEFLLAEARRKNADVLVTGGALGSHHVLATSIFGARFGFEVHAVLVPQPWTEHVERNLRAMLAAGAHVHPTESFGGAAAKMIALAAGLRLKGRRPYTISYGGSTPVGTVAYVAAGLELARQILDGELPEPRAIYVALGSGGTAMGLALGIAAADLPTRVMAVRVTDRVLMNRATLRALSRATLHRMRTFHPDFPDVITGAMRRLEIDATQFGDGYGRGTAAAEEALALARDREALVLDSTYTGKAMAAMLAAARERRVEGPLLFWSTLSSADLSPTIATAPEAPPWAQEFARL